MFGTVSKEIHKTFVLGEDLSRSSVMRMKHEDLHLFTHTTQILQLQTDANKAERRAFGQTISQQIEANPDFMDFILSVKRQISTLVGTFSPSRCVVMALSGHTYCSRGCWWTSGNDEHSDTLNQWEENLSRPWGGSGERTLDTVIYQQDRATLHCSNASFEYIHLTYLYTDSTPVVQTTLGRHILQFYSLRIIFCGDT